MTTSELSAASNTTASSSHCWNEDGTFHPVCMVVIGVSIFVGIFSIAAIVKITKQFQKLTRERALLRGEEHELDELGSSSRSQRYQIEITPIETNPLTSNDEEIKTVETSFMTSPGGKS